MVKHPRNSASQEQYACLMREPSEWSQQQYACLMRDHYAREHVANKKGADPVPSPMLPTMLFCGGNSNVSETSSLTTSTRSDRSHAGSVMHESVDKALLARAEKALEKLANNNKIKGNIALQRRLQPRRKPNKRSRRGKESKRGQAQTKGSRESS
jgi:hypothetical protein